MDILKPVIQEIVSSEQMYWKIEEQSIETDTWQYSQCIKSEIEFLKTTDKPYNCEHCSIAFIQHINLSEHIKSHIWDKLYFYEHCD